MLKHATVSTDIGNVRSVSNSCRRFDKPRPMFATHLRAREDRHHGGDRLSDAGPAPQASVQAQADGTCTVIEMMVTQELGDPFRRDALPKPVRRLDKCKADARQSAR